MLREYLLKRAARIRQKVDERRMYALKHGWPPGYSLHGEMMKISVAGLLEDLARALRKVKKDGA